MTAPVDKTRKPGSKASNKQPPHSASPLHTPLWQIFLMPAVAILVFFLLLEGSLAIFGIKPGLETEDPFVGYASNSSLFISAKSPVGNEIMSTAPQKTDFFNWQSFPRVKGSNTYRIFTLGGSTTYGRPYDDTTSFSGWLRELLSAADARKNWEVINAGGISYASYRVAHLMQELIQYQPDLFIIYTGHNEFLEERTYSQIRKIPPMIRSLVSVLSKTRSWSALSHVLSASSFKPQEDKTGQSKLSGEVNAILDQAIGLERYHRDDKLKENVLYHYRLSLERMITLARSVGAKVVFINPASSLKDCTPFKSEDTAGLDSSARQQSHTMLIDAKRAIRLEQWSMALELLDEAANLNPRHAEVQYRKGQALLALGQAEKAEQALIIARDEDVCPLRALTPVSGILKEVTKDQDVLLIDYVKLLNDRMLGTKGYPIPGEELFLDHVHPTIEGHKILALALFRTMQDAGWVQPRVGWDSETIQSVSETIAARIDLEVHGQALTNLARVLSWAKKPEDAVRSALRAREISGDFPQVAADSSSILASIYIAQGQPERAAEILYTTLKTVPNALELHLKLGEVLFEPPYEQLEKAAAHFLLVCQGNPTYGTAFTFYGLTMGKRGLPLIAYDSLVEALRLNPNDALAQKTLSWLRPQLGSSLPTPLKPLIRLEPYPSEAPKKLVQLRRDSSGRYTAHGIIAEFHENGRLKSFTDVSSGRPRGLEITWSHDGQELSRRVLAETNH